MRLTFFAAASLALSVSLVAHADTFDFSFGTDTSTFSGTGEFVANLTAADVYTIISISGTTNTGAGNKMISGLEPVGAFEGNDNVVNDNNGVFNFDNYGVSYDLANGAQVNIYMNNDGDAEILERAGGTFVDEAVPYTITDVSAATPEPSSIALLGSGLLGLAGVMKRRFA